MEKYDYYTIKAAWKGAGVSQRADDIKAAEKIAEDLKGNGFIDVVIFGVKAGKREKLEGGKQAKPKAQERPRKAEKTKSQENDAPKVKTPVKAIKKQEKKAQDNAGQLDLFTPPPKNNNSFTLLFEHEELKTLNDALRMFKGVFSNELWYKNLIECVTNSAYRGKTININLNMLEIDAMIKALEEFSKIYEDSEAIKLKNQLVKIAK